MKRAVQICLLLTSVLSSFLHESSQADEADLIWSTFLGGSPGQSPCQFEGEDRGHGIAVDDSGYIYVTGYTKSDDFPITPGALDSTHSPCRPPTIPLTATTDVFVAKFDPTGSTLMYSTFLGGDSHNEDVGYGIALGDPGIAYLTGYTGSSDFPTTYAAYDTSHNGDHDVFVVKLNLTTRCLLYATFLGGSDEEFGYGLGVDGAGYSCVTGYTTSTDFPISATAFDTAHSGGDDAFVVKLHPAGDRLQYTTFLGGSGNEYGRAIALDDSGHAYLTGFVNSSNFPTTAGAFDTTYNDGDDVFATKLSICGDIDPPEAIDDLAIAAENLTKGGDIRLRWSEPSDNVGATRYIIYCSDAGTAPGDSLAETADTTYLDSGAAGIPYTNYCYTVKAVDAANNKFEESNQVGEYDFQLLTTTGTDYTWISLPLELDSLTMASDLEAHIEAHSSPAVNCLTVSEWNPVAQAYTNYITVPHPMGDFTIAPGRPYRVEVTTDAQWPDTSKGLRRFHIKLLRR